MYDRARHLEWFWRLNVKSTICNHSNIWQDPKYEKQFVKRYQIFKQTKTWQIGLQSFPLACQLIQFSANKALCYPLSYCLSLKHQKISIFQVARNSLLKMYHASYCHWIKLKKKYFFDQKHIFEFKLQFMHSFWLKLADTWHTLIASSVIPGPMAAVLKMRDVLDPWDRF